MSEPTPFKIADIGALQRFQFGRFLNEDPLAHTLTLLGSFPRAEASGETAPAIIRLEKTALASDYAVARFSSGLFDTVRLIESNDIYTWLFGWLSSSSAAPPHVKINIIFPATDVHIRKYSKQELLMVRETPALYQRIVEPYIAAIPASRTQWVEDILSGRAEADKILYSDPSPVHGFVLLPDMKWDLTTLSALYLVAIARAPALRSLRDLRRAHLLLLEDIRAQAQNAAKDKWSVEPEALRMFVHYQPSYYRFHVHIVKASMVGSMGSTVGQAHLLDNIISLLDLDPVDGPGIFARLTLTYGLGAQHALFAPLRAAQADLAPSESARGA